MKTSKKVPGKGMTSSEYLERLILEEKRSRMLADLETDPKKKARAKKKNQKILQLIQRVRKAATGGIETADARAMSDLETPGQTKTIL